MSSHPPSASQQGSRQSGAGGGEDVRATRGSGRGGRGRVTVYLHAVTDEQAAVLTDDSNKCLQEIKMKTGADVKFDSNPSPVPGMKIVVIRGVPGQIEAAVGSISEKTGVQETISAQAQTFWLRWVEAAFPDLDSRAYFLPPVYVNRVPMSRQSVGGQDVLVLHASSTQRADLSQATMIASTAAQDSSSPLSPVQDSDMRDDKAMERLLVCLQKMSEQNKEVLVGISHLRYGQYLSESFYSAAASHLPSTKTFPTGLSKDRQGDFDLLLIHRYYGLVVCEVKAFGENWNKCDMSQQDICRNLRVKIKEAIQSLKKAEAMLSHLVSDIAPGLRITKTIAVPNLTTDQVQRAVSDDTDLTEDLCRCLGTTDPDDIAALCLCCDQLSDPKTPCDVSSHVMRELGHWWQRRVAGAGPDSHMTPEVYKTLVARFCGPATTVSVPCTCPPRVSVKTLGQAVWWTGECYTAVITLFPEQVHLLHTAPPTLFVTGPPGTGKTVVLLLMAIQWLRCGHHVYVVSTWMGSRAASIMLYHLLLQTINTQNTAVVSPSQLHLLQYEFDCKVIEVEKAVNDLSQAAMGGSLYVIVDEAGKKSNFETFCDKLLTQVPRLHLWAASCYHGDAPARWQVEYLTRPLRSPPAVVREVEEDEIITKQRRVHPYSERGVPYHTDGPPVRRLYHEGQDHTGVFADDCVKCGREVASFLHSLRVGVPVNAQASLTVTASNSDTHLCLQWRDVLVLYYFDNVSDDSRMMTTLREENIPVKVMKDDDIEDVATARSDVVWVTSGHRVRGLERKVVVCLEHSGDVNKFVRLQLVSRCTSQLLIVYP